MSSSPRHPTEEVIREAVYHAEEREVLLTGCMWRQLCVLHESTCDMLTHHFYSSAGVLLGEAIAAAGCCQQQVQRVAPLRSVTKPSAGRPVGGPIHTTLNGATSATGRSISTQRSSAAVRPSSVPRAISTTRTGSAQRRGVSPTVAPARTAAAASTSVVGGPRPATAAGASQRIASSPRPSLRSSVNSATSNTNDRELVTIPGYRRTISPVRRGQLVPAPAPSVKALFEERRRCDVRRDTLQDESGGGHSPVDGTADLSMETSQPSSQLTVTSNGRRIEQRRLSVLHSVPVDHQRTIASQRSPVARRTSPVRSSSAQRTSVFGGTAAATTAAATTIPSTVSKLPLETSALLRKSPVRRLVAPSPVLARASTTTTPTGVNARSASAVKSERSLSTLADPRRSVGGDTSSRGASPRSAQDEPVSSSRSQSLLGVRRPSPQAQLQQPRSGSHVLPRASASGGIPRRSTPRQAVPSGRSSMGAPELPTIDYVVEVFQCGVNRTLEVDLVPPDSLTPLRVNDLLLEIDGKSMSTVDQLRAHFELMYRGSSANGRRLSTAALPSTISVSLLRGTEFVMVDVPLPRSCGAATTTRSQSPAAASVVSHDDVGSMSTSDAICVN